MKRQLINKGRRTLKRRAMRTRQRLRATGRLRLSVFRSLKHIHAQVIDDKKGVTLAAASSLDASLADKDGSGGKIGMARKVGAELARRALAAGVERVVFDRGGYIYHGRVRALAEAAREGSLKF